MQNFLRDLSIKTKLTLVIMTTCTLLLIVIGSVVLVSQIYASRVSLKQEVAILADSLSENLRQPLVLGKFQDAEGLLDSLVRQKNIQAAYLFDHDGAPVAQYLNQQDSAFILAALRTDFQPANRLFWTTPGQVRVLSGWHHFSSFSPIHYEGIRVGTLYLLSDLHNLYENLYTVAFGSLLAFLLLLSFSWLLAGFLQKPVSAPVLELAGLMHDISDFKDYSIRAGKTTRDEIGVLVDGFNNMLEQIESHQRSLAEHQQHLENMVAARTRELQVAVAELKVAREQADSANEAKSDFLSRMTHELRTPLIGVLGMNELMARTHLSDQQNVLVQTIQKSGEELLQLISDVLDFSRIEAGKLSLDVNEVELHRVIEDVVRLLAPQASDKGLLLVSDIPLDAARKVRVDETRLRQILMNLIGNALKFTNAGSIVVSLEADRQESGCGEFTLKVSDTGCGVDEASAGRIFDVFYQADGGNDRSSSGAGLGLAIVKQLVDLMKGDVRFFSTSGQGSCFQVSLTLPLVSGDAVCVSPDKRGAQLLLCLEDGLTVKILETRLRELAYKPIVIHTAEAALYWLNSARRKGRIEPLAGAFLSRQLCLPTGQPLFQFLREDPQWLQLRRILLFDDHGQSLPLSTGESRLYLPVTWSSLKDALFFGRGELTLLPGGRGHAGKEAKSGRHREHRALVVGCHVASRELLRLKIEKKQYIVDLLHDYDQLLYHLQENNYQVVFFDCSREPLQDMTALLKKCQPALPFSVLISEAPPAEECSSVIDYFLGTPVNDVHLEELFELLKDKGCRPDAREEEQSR